MSTDTATDKPEDLPAVGPRLDRGVGRPERAIRPMTDAEYAAGHAVCDCGEYTHVFRQCALQRLPKDYSGERCQRCDMWMCRVDKMAAPSPDDDPEALRRERDDMLRLMLGLPFDAPVNERDLAWARAAIADKTPNVRANRPSGAAQE